MGWREYLFPVKETKVRSLLGEDMYNTIMRAASLDLTNLSPECFTIEGAHQPTGVALGVIRDASRPDVSISIKKLLSSSVFEEGGVLYTNAGIWEHEDAYASLFGALNGTANVDLARLPELLFGYDPSGQMFSRNKGLVGALNGLKESVKDSNPALVSKCESIIKKLEGFAITDTTQLPGYNDLAKKLYNTEVAPKERPKGYVETLSAEAKAAVTGRG